MLEIRISANRRRFLGTRIGRGLRCGTIALMAAVLIIAVGAPAVRAQTDELKAADSKLNTLYKEIEARLKGDQPTLHLLTTAQHAWIAFRDSECAFAASGVEGGSVYPEIVASCDTDLTEKRIADFNAYLNCKEGDMGCPVPGE